MKHALIAGAAGVVAALAIVSGAIAAKSDPPLALDCGTDGTLNVVVVPGNGLWTPAKIVGGGVLIPIAFSNAHGTFTDNAGNTETFTDPDVSKPGPANKHILNCHAVIVFEDANGTGTFEFDVKAFRAGA